MQAVCIVVDRSAIQRNRQSPLRCVLTIVARVRVRVAAPMRVHVSAGLFLGARWIAERSTTMAFRG